MSSALQSFQNTVNGYTDAAGTVNSYVSNYDSEFFSDWRNAALAKSGIDSAKIKAGAEIAGTAGLAIEAIKKLRGGKPKTKEEPDDEDDDEPDDENDGDEDGDGEPDGTEDLTWDDEDTGVGPAEAGEDVSRFQTQDLPDDAPEPVQNFQKAGEGELDQSPDLEMDDDPTGGAPAPDAPDAPDPAAPAIEGTDEGAEGGLEAADVGGAAVA
ncbi:MAG: hypothetical protein H8E55_15545, partial [Pelagibacterales bacterium]|nr:hypothetical protein [Pelagibacterales bacterium]